MIIKINTLIIIEKILSYLIITIIICFVNSCHLLKYATTVLSHLFYLHVFGFFLITETESKLLSYQSEYEVSLGDTDIVRVPGKTYVDKAYGQLFIDWINNCDNSWVSNQRMMTRFINSYGVGTVNEINYSINENINGENMEFVLEVKENAELVERTIGKAIKDNNLIVQFPQTDKKDLTFPNDVVFPHTFLKEITDKLNGEEKIIVKKVYEGNHS